MSIRAHKVLRLEYNGESFNLWHDDELMSILEESSNFYLRLDNDCCGVTEILDSDFDEIKEKLEEVIDGLENCKTFQPERKEKAEHYKEVLKEMEEEIKKEGYIRYYCF
ncbi:MAG: hypothetical protein FJW63_08550 [Actinobacteria bacterium]|nr:hypothetical protein [Actinomycetota bacterium]